MVTEGATGAFHVKVDLIEELGSDALAYGTIAEQVDASGITSGAGDNQIIVRVDPRKTPMKGDVIYGARSVRASVTCSGRRAASASRPDHVSRRAGRHQPSRPPA